ncbi:hypothetical protein [Xanthobacter sp.]|uniref:hypothetical protein n=1 Tax=Xanthobacter sp. TaxID=35809 RepID=UPI00345B63C1
MILPPGPQPCRSHNPGRPCTDTVPGLFRSKAVSPPRQEDGNVRIVEIGDIDRQGCGGTHLPSTRQARPVRILKVDNKGRQNRRVKIGFALYSMSARLSGARAPGRWIEALDPAVL